jgi:hypothetical protein
MGRDKDAVTWRTGLLYSRVPVFQRNLKTRRIFLLQMPPCANSLDLIVPQCIKPSHSVELSPLHRRYYVTHRICEQQHNIFACWAGIQDLAHARQVPYPSPKMWLFYFLFFLQYWGLNSRPHTCWAGAVPLEPVLQSFLLLLFFQIGSDVLTFNLDPPTYAFLIAEVTGMYHYTGLYAEIKPH